MPDRLGQAGSRLRLEAAARLPGIRRDLVHLDLRQLLSVADAADEQLEAAAEASPLRRAHAATAMAARRSTSSFAARQ